VIIDGSQLTGEDRAVDRVLNPSEGALDLRGIFHGQLAIDIGRCIEPLVQVGLFTRA
jgi:hypothetical protein